MPRRNNPSRRLSGRGRRNGRSASSTTVLRDIREELRNNLCLLPRIRDVMPMKLGRYRTYIFCITWDVQTLTTSTSSTVNYAWYAALNALPGYINIVECFDQYRFLQVVYNFVPLAQPSFTGATGVIYTALDYEDANTPTGPQELEQYDTCMTAPFGQQFQRVVTPRVSVAAYGSGVFSSYASMRSQWVDSGSTGVQFYGIKASIPAFGTVAYQYMLKGTAYLQVRSQI